MYLKDEIEQLMAAVTKEQMDAVAGLPEEELDDQSLEYVIVGRPLPEHHRRLWVVFERGDDEVQAAVERLGEEAEVLSEEDINARTLEIYALKNKFDFVGGMFWEDVKREFPELRSQDNVSLLEGWRIAWSVSHPCQGCPIRRQCDSRYGKLTPKEERHAKMDEDGWDPDVVYARLQVSQMLGLDPEDMDGLGIEVTTLEDGGRQAAGADFDPSDFSDGPVGDDVDGVPAGDPVRDADPEEPEPEEEGTGEE